MAISGRRSVDLLRLQWSGIRINEKRVSAVIGKDKTHRNSLVSFTFDLDEYDLPLGKSDFIKHLKIGVKHGKGAVFKNFKKQQVTTKSKTFRIHALRNRKAISMLIKGSSVEDVKSKIGWATTASLLRYTKVSINFITTFKSYSSLVKFLFELR